MATIAPPAPLMLSGVGETDLGGKRPLRDEMIGGLNESDTLAVR